MSYVGAVGVLMTGSGPKELMKASFGGVTKMLSGKNFPQNTRALRIVVEQVLHQILCEVNTFEELMQELKTRASKSGTAKYWVENLILAVLLMQIFIRAEREGEWALHLLAVNKWYHISLLQGTSIMPAMAKSTTDQCKNCMGKP